MGLKPLHECREKRIQARMKAPSYVDSESLKIELKLLYVNGNIGFFSVNAEDFNGTMKGFLLEGEGEGMVRAIEVFPGTSLAEVVTRDMLLSLDKCPLDKRKELWNRVLMKRQYARGNWKLMKVKESKCSFSRG